MEALSASLTAEKEEKRALEKKINEMNGRMLGGGSVGGGTGGGGGGSGGGGGGGDDVSVDALPEFQSALRDEQRRISSGYERKLEELESERHAMEAEKLQTGRYKQLLLKQRDIMVQLTVRLNERDQVRLASTHTNTHIRNSNFIFLHRFN
jgi:kinesin family protein 3/17